jgi:Reverse transcriptase (RNA-dependent DNA polymerase)
MRHRHTLDDHPLQLCRSTRTTRTNPVIDYQVLHDPGARPQTLHGCDIPEPNGGETEAAHMIQMITLNEGYKKAYKATIKDGHVPQTYHKAMTHPDAEKWREATDAEIQAQLDNGTWELVKLPPDQKTIGCRWVFRIKLNSDGSVERYKARLVAKGYSQHPGIDFDKVFAPTTQWAMLRAILSQAALSGAYIKSINISNAYLNGILDTNVSIYMDQPKGYYQGGVDQVCRLQKGLYGL